MTRLCIDSRMAAGFFDLVGQLVSRLASTLIQYPPIQCRLQIDLSAWIALATPTRARRVLERRHDDARGVKPGRDFGGPQVQCLSTPALGLGMTLGDLAAQLAPAVGPLPTTGAAAL